MLLIVSKINNILSSCLRWLVKDGVGEKFRGYYVFFLRIQVCCGMLQLKKIEVKYILFKIKRNIDCDIQCQFFLNEVCFRKVRYLMKIFVVINDGNMGLKFFGYNLNEYFILEYIDLLWIKFYMFIDTKYRIFKFYVILLFWVMILDLNFWCFFRKYCFYYFQLNDLNVKEFFQFKIVRDSVFIVFQWKCVVI